jgi:steroid 5-alpha reductase family enzyme
MTNFLIWLGWNCDNTFYPPATAMSFWSSPLGLFCTATLCLTSAWRVLHRKSHADLFDAVWHMVMTMVTGAAFFIGWRETAPHHLVKSLIILMTIRGVYKVAKMHLK